MKVFFASLLFALTWCGLQAAELSCYVFPVGREVEFYVVPESTAEKHLFDRISVSFNSPDGRCQDGSYSPVYELGDLPCKLVNGKLLCRVKLHIPGRYHIQLMLKEGHKPRPYGSKLAVFALPDELVRLRPYRGDFHIHLSRGKEKINPRTMLGLIRKVGCDFIAVTDYLNWNSSKLVREFSEKNNLGITVINGEELFTGKGEIKVIALGVNHELAGMLKPCKPLEDTEKETKPDIKAMKSDAVMMADLVRKNGGVSVLSHPFWRKNYRYEVPIEVSEYLLRNGVFDAVELVNVYCGYNCILDTLSRLWQIERECGRKIPAIGVSDTVNPSIRYYGVHNTTVFAAGKDEKSLLEALKAGLCVTSLGVVRRLMFFGDPLLVDYSRFLEDFYWPHHDTLAAQQSGRIFLIRGEPDDKTELAIIANTQKLLDEFSDRFFYGGDISAKPADNK